MNYVNEWKARKQEESEEWEEKRKRQIEEEKMQKEQIIFALTTEYGIPKETIRTNGYWFDFSYRGLMVNFVNQTNRFCGEIHRPPANEDERECLRDSSFIMHTDEYPEFQKEFNFRHFVINGSPLEALRQVMELAELPLEKVIPLEDECGTIHSVD